MTPSTERIAEAQAVVDQFARQHNYRTHGYAANGFRLSWPREGVYNPNDLGEGGLDDDTEGYVAFNIPVGDDELNSINWRYTLSTRAADANANVLHLVWKMFCLLMAKAGVNGREGLVALSSEK